MVYFFADNTDLGEYERNKKNFYEWNIFKFILSIGNCIIHIVGTEVTVRLSGRKLSPVAIFVSSGLFGVITGGYLQNIKSLFYLSCSFIYS